MSERHTTVRQLLERQPPDAIVMVGVDRFFPIDINGIESSHAALVDEKTGEYLGVDDPVEISAEERSHGVVKQVVIIHVRAPAAEVDRPLAH